MLLARGTVLGCTLFLVAATSFAQDSQPAKAPQTESGPLGLSRKAAVELEKLDGTWEYVSVMKSGSSSDKPTAKAYISKQTIHYNLAMGDFTMHFSLATDEPSFADTQVEKVTFTTWSSPFGPPDPKLAMPGLIKQDGETITLCYNFDPTFSGKKVDFPKELASTDKVPSNLIVLRRISKAVPQEIIAKIDEKNPVKQAAKPSN